MAAFYAGIPVGHVEAGLRSGNPLDPFPEEMNRTIIARLARWHFAPTATAAANLTREGCAPAAVSVVGNTVVDAVRYTLATAAAVPDGLPEDLATWALGGRLAVVTMHRRENWGAAIEGVAREVGRALERHPELRVVWPVHPNPDVQAAVAAGVAGLAPGDAARLRLIAPLDYAPMLWLLRAAWLVLTDSGGIQEEAAALDRPVLVLRRTTERPEVIDGGGGALVGTDPAAVAGWIDRLMTDAAAYGAMRCAENPFGDGEAGRRIAGLLTAALADRRRPRADAGPGDAASAAGRPVIDRRTMRMLDDLARTAASGDGHSGDGSGDGHSGDGASGDGASAGSMSGEPRAYRDNPIDALGAGGIDLFVNVSASPFAAGKPAVRRALVAAAAREWGVPFVYVNQVGANTELVFDGDSQVQNARGEVVWRGHDFEPDFFVWDTGDAAPCAAPLQDDTAAVHDALVLGIRDYVAKTGPAVFNTALVGLSGGIDSALTCALAVEALGADRVVGITMPSKYSSAGSVSDARLLADALGIAFHEVSIRPAVDAFDVMLAPVLGGEPAGVTEENLQARARGVTLMAVSNAQGHLLLTTGNKSEAAVGYTTLYGDMAGGLAVLSDVFKTDVYRVARHVNARAGRAVIPDGTLTKPPSAELRPDQTDQDSLPPYDILDAVLRRYVERHASVASIVRETGLDEALVARVAGMVDRNEYKRRQAAPGLRVSGKAFGVGRRLPVVMRLTRVETSPFPQSSPAAR